MSQKKHKERRRLERAMFEDMEQTHVRLDELCDNIEEAEDVPYYSCSLNTVHDEGCAVDPTEGEAASGERIYTAPSGTLRKCVELDRWDVAIAHEDVLWARAGMHREHVQHNLYEMDITCQALVQVLIEHCGVTQDQMNAIYKPLLFENLRNFRQAVEPDLRRERIKRGEGGSRIIGPNGSPIGEG